ncbi:MAG: TonB-dependent receptor [Alteripontixanthobacter sp.]
MSNRFTKASLLTGTFMAGAMLASPALAQQGTNAGMQDDDNDLTDQDVALQAAPMNEDGGLIIVTGSRIAQRNVDTAAPIAVIQDEEFELSGTVNVENVVNTLPQVIPGTTSFSNNPGNGTATLNLRGLGTTRTLVLVNGRRWLSFDTAQVVDLNTIPSFLIDSVDVVTGGASAVYGSDALSGVVNFRLREVEGAELGGQYNITEEGDGESYELHGALGATFDDGRGSATVFGEYFNRRPVFQGDRAFSNFALGGETFGEPLQQFGSSTLPSGVIRFFGGAEGAGLFTTTDDPLTNPPTDDPDTPDVNEGDPITGVGAFGAPGAGNAVVFDMASTFRARAGDTYNYAPVNYLQIPQERYLLGGYADYEFSDGHEFYTEVAYVNNRVAQELAATPVTGTFTVDLATVQPFLSAASFNTLQEIDQSETDRIAAFNAAMQDQVPDDPADPDTLGVQFTPLVDNPGQIDAFLQRRTVETGARNSLDERNAFRVLGGVRGEITDWLNYDAYYMFARTRNANVQEGNISRSAFQAGLDGTGTPINIFGPNTLTADQVAAISIQAQNGDISSVEVASAALSGFLGDLTGAGDVGFALGAEYRKVASQFIPDTALSSGDVIGFNAGQATEGGYDVKELFAEINVPLIDTDGGMRLEVTGAGRYSDYSLEAVGGVYTYAGGVKFAPVQDVILRGQYQRAVRAPNVGELFGGQAIGFPGATDPCSTSGATSGALREICIANGVPAANLGNAAALQLNAQIPALFGGNPNLQEETSESFTAGIVLQPSFIPGLTITADYFDIEIEDAITIISLGQSFDLCFNQVQDQNDTVCDPFFAFGPIRNAAGQITVDSPPVLGGQNIATFGVSGVDLEMSYSTTLPFSLLTDTGEQGLNLSFLGTWTESANFLAFPGADVVECSGEFGGDCGEPTPSFKWTSRASFIDGPLTTSIRWRHLSGVDDNDDDTLFTDFNGIERVNAYDLIDLTLSAALNEQFTINFGVTNLFDTLPGAPEFNDAGQVSNRPNSLLLGDNQEQANTYPSTYDVLGRRYFVSAAFKF